MKPPAFHVLYANFSNRNSVPQDVLFQEIGWEKLTPDPAYRNTCAIRVSLALIKSGITLAGRMKILNGPFKGRLIEPGQAALSRLLVKAFGEPEKFRSGADAKAKIGMRNGIVSFWGVSPESDSDIGHIDLAFGAAGGVGACASDCYWASKGIWFWPLK